MAQFFINRPIVAICISILIVIFGTLSIFTLPLAQFPDIIPPVVNLTATYPGGDCQTVAESIATPLEEQLMGVEGMDYMTSTNGNDGSSGINVLFKSGVDPDLALVYSQMRYGQAQSQLPAEVQRIGVQIRKRGAMPMMLISLNSPDESFSSLDLSNYGTIRLLDELKRVEGVSDVMIFGSGKYAMRVWLDPLKMARLNMSTAEVIAAIAEQNTVNPAGQIGAEPAPAGQDQTYSVRTRGRLSTEEQFKEIIVREGKDGMVYLRDIAEIELGAEVYGISSRVNGAPSATIAVYQDAKANAIRTADGVMARMEQLRAELPPGVEYAITLDTTRPVREGIAEIIQTLIEALALVIIVVFVFLQGWRATIIPFFAVPVSIIGTFALFPLLGFTINTISMMGIVLAIGLVVDDAIVVVEAVEHHIEKGLSARDATIVAMKEVSSPVVAIALVLSAVFLPCLIIPGVGGALFQQFAVTISVSVLISAFNALSLSPALSAMLLRPKDPNARGPLQFGYRMFNKGFGLVNRGYRKTCGLMIRWGLLSLVLLGVISAFVLPMGKMIPGGFLPAEDQGYLLGMIKMPTDSSLQLTSEACEEFEAVLKAVPEVENYTVVMGLNFGTMARMPSMAFSFIQLKAMEKRNGKTSSQIYQEIAGRVQKGCVKGFVIPIEPPALPGVGSFGGVSFLIQDTAGKGQDFLIEHATAFKNALSNPANSHIVNTMAIVDTMSTAGKMDYVDIDVQKAIKQKVPVAEANAALKNYLGSYFVNYISKFNRQWPVYVQANPESRANIENIKSFYVKNRDGVAVPLDSITTVTTLRGPEFIMRQNRYDSYSLQVNAAPGVSSAQVMEFLEQLHAKIMPDGIALDYTGMSHQEKMAQGGLPLWFIFVLSGVFTFLILASLYESWSSPISIFMTVPIAVIGAFGALIIFKQELNIYAEIGLIMLIGLAAKNAILIVEFAVLEMERGKGLYEACLSGAQVRLRPILMTSLAFIFGCVPLAMATGSGAIARQVIGNSVIGGMISVTVLGVFFIPVCFYMIKRMTGVPSGIPKGKQVTNRMSLQLFAWMLLFAAVHFGLVFGLKWFDDLSPAVSNVLSYPGLLWVGMVAKYDAAALGLIAVNSLLWGLVFAVPAFAVMRCCRKAEPM